MSANIKNLEERLAELGMGVPHTDQLYMALRDDEIADLRAALAAESRKSLELSRVYAERGLQIERLELALSRAAATAPQPVAEREQKERAQRERMAQRFAVRPRTPATADFDLPAPNDLVQPVAVAGLTDAEIDAACVEVLRCNYPRDSAGYDRAIARAALDASARQIATLHAVIGELTEERKAQTAPATEYGCHIDLADDEKPDSCVIDSGRMNDCVYASRYGKDGRKHCGEWRPIKFTAPAAPTGSGE